MKGLRLHIPWWMYKTDASNDIPVPSEYGLSSGHLGLGARQGGAADWACAREQLWANKMGLVTDSFKALGPGIRRWYCPKCCQEAAGGEINCPICGLPLGWYHERDLWPTANSPFKVQK